jgi:outer membrane protein insertion porin family
MHFRNFALALALISAPLCAQTHSAPAQKFAKNSNRITEIVVSGSTRFQPAELVSATGLKIGEDGTDEKFQTSAGLLAASGMFTDVIYSWVSSPQGLRVEFKVQDVATLLPAQFDNFVWMTRDDLLRALRQRRPLFTGEIPNAGEMYTQLGGDMQAILADMHVNATVKANPVTPQNGALIIGFQYTVEGVSIPIRTVDFPGATPEMAAILKQTSETKIDSDYSEGALLAFTRLDLLPQYMTRGYLHARFQAPEFTPADPATNLVAVRLPVQEGLCYELKDVQWSGNTAYPAQELAKILKVKSGKVANKVQLDDDLGAISKIYGTRGYMRARLKAVPTFHDQEKTVSFLIEVTEGDQYRMGNVRLEGASEALAKKIQELWKLPAGNVFDSSYASFFLSGLGQQFDLRAYRISIRDTVNDASKTVDVSLRFVAH